MHSWPFYAVKRKTKAIKLCKKKFLQNYWCNTESDRRVKNKLIKFPKRVRSPTIVSCKEKKELKISDKGQVTLRR